MTPPSVCPAPLSPCCGAAIERVYYKFGSLRPCNPDDADYSEDACAECGDIVEIRGDGPDDAPEEASGMDDDDLERMDRSAACVNFDLRMLMRDAPEEVSDEK